MTAYALAARPWRAAMLYWFDDWLYRRQAQTGHALALQSGSCFRRSICGPPFLRAAGACLGSLGHGTRAVVKRKKDACSMVS